MLSMIWGCLSYAMGLQIARFIYLHMHVEPMRDGSLSLEIYHKSAIEDLIQLFKQTWAFIKAVYRAGRWTRRYVELLATEFGINLQIPTIVLPKLPALPKLN
jgi:hypothetical protein